VNPGGNQTPIFGTVTPSTTMRGINYGTMLALMSNSVGANSLYLTQYSLAGYTLTGGSAYTVIMTFLSVT